MLKHNGHAGRRIQAGDATDQCFKLLLLRHWHFTR